MTESHNPQEGPINSGTRSRPGLERLASAVAEIDEAAFADHERSVQEAQAGVCNFAVDALAVACRHRELTAVDALAIIEDIEATESL